MFRAGWVLLLSCFWGELHAQVPHFSLKTVQHGLPANAVHALARDREGFVWVGTEEGLSRFDGTTFRTFRHEQGVAGSLSHSHIKSIFVDASNTVWVGTHLGLDKLDRRTGSFLHVLPTSGERLNGGILHMAQDRTGTVWATSGQSLVVLGHGEPHRVNLSQFAPHHTDLYVHDLESDAHGALWLGIHNSAGFTQTCRVVLSSRTCAEGHTFPGRLVGLINEGLMPTLVVLRRENTLVFAYAHHVEPVASVPLPADFAEVEFGKLALVRESPKRLWLGTSRGLLELTLAPYSVRPVETIATASLRGREHKALVTTHDGVILVGSSAGLHTFNPQAPYFEPIDSGGMDSAVRMVEDQSGHLWIGASNGLFRLDPRTQRVTRHPLPQPQLAVTDLYFDPVSKVLYVSRDGRITLINPVTGTRTGPSEAIPTRLQRDVESWKFFEGRDGRWFAAGSFTLLTHQPFGQWEEIRLPDSLRASITHVYEDRLRRIWVATERGVLLYNPAQRNFSVALKNIYISDFIELSGYPDVLWMATVGSGLIRYEVNQWTYTSVTTREGLPSNTILGMLPDPDGISQWLTTSAGLVHFHAETRRVLRFTDSEAQSGSFTPTTQWAHSSGYHYHAGVSGIQRFQPPVRVTPEPPRIVISSLSYEGDRASRLWSIGDTLQLPRISRAFRLELTTLSFGSPEQQPAWSRLRGYDNVWQPLEAGRGAVTYALLPPGFFRFEVAFRTDTSAPSVLIHVVARPALLEVPVVQWVILLLILVVLGAVGFTVYRFRIQTIARREARRRQVLSLLAESRERERLHVAQELHDTHMQRLYAIGHELDRLSMQPQIQSDAVQEVRLQLNQTGQELRAMLADLRMHLVRHLGLTAALEAYARRVRERSPDLDVSIDCDTGNVELPEAVEHAVYRIAQEALRNAERHAEAESVNVHIRATPSELFLTVEDDGKGFSYAEDAVDLARQNRFGLIGARERTELLGGDFSVQTAPGQGTRIHVRIPIAPDFSLRTFVP